MPYKFNEPRRHKIPRARYRVQNWPAYDRALQQRGSLTMWVTPEALARAQASGEPVDVVIDATGLKVHGAGEWLAERHGERGHRGWRKLHLAVDPGSGEILACELTSNEEGDASQVGPLLEQIPGPIASVIADGAYDGEPVYAP
jgi:hypothetical protein